MPDPITQKLDAAIQTLLKQRQEQVKALEEIDATFRRLGFQAPQNGDSTSPHRRGHSTAPGKQSAPKPTTAKTSRRPKPRGSFKITGPETIIAFVKAAGKDGRTGSEIAAHWDAQGRGAGVYAILTQLVKAKKLKRQKLSGRQGSRFTVA